MKILILSDIHANLSALKAVIKDAYSICTPDALILLGDNIDYGMRSNETLVYLDEFIEQNNIQLLASVWGNHEDAILNNNMEDFSTSRGKECALNTLNNLNDFSRNWLFDNAVKSGKTTATIDGKKVLIVHGSIEDPLWGKLGPALANYSLYYDFDIVISGHSHIPAMFTILLDDNNPERRNKKSVSFYNPGSVGQPRNHNPHAHYAIWDTNSGIQFNHVEYDVIYEQSLYTDCIDGFYKERLSLGI